MAKKVPQPRPDDFAKPGGYKWAERITDYLATPGTGGALTKAVADTYYVPLARTLTAGTGLTGGGDLSADRTLAVTGILATFSGLPNVAGWLHNDGFGVLAYSTPTKADVGLGSVENTALSTWAGSANITTLGTVVTGSFPAANLTGATLAAGVTGSSLTSVGTLTGLTVSGVSNQYSGSLATSSMNLGTTANVGGQASAANLVPDLITSPYKYDNTAGGNTLNKWAMYNNPGSAVYGVGMSATNGFGFFAWDKFVFSIGTTNIDGTGATRKLSITSTGIGFGPATPAAPLDMGTNSTTGKPFWLMYNDGAGVNMGIWRDTPSANIAAFVVNSAGLIAFGKSTSAATPTFGTEFARFDNSGRFGLGVTTLTAKLHIAAGSATASTSPIKLTSGPVLTVAEAGAAEFLTDNYYLTGTTGPTRKAIRDLVYRGISALRTLDGSDELVDCTANTFTVTLPTAVGYVKEYVIKNSGTGIITLATTSSQTIDGVASGIITLVQGDCIHLRSNGANWIIT